MASSGTFTFRTNRDEVIKGALRLVGGYDPENSSGPTATQISLAAEALNLLVKSWEAIGLHLWERKYGVIFPQPDQTAYLLGTPGPGGDHAVLSNPIGNGFVSTTLASAASSGASSIVVTSLTGSAITSAGLTQTSITNAYNIGIELDSGTVQWTTVNGAVSTTTITLAAVLTGAAASGNRVYCYQTKMIRPLRILDAFVRRYPGETDSPVRIISKDEYNRYGNKVGNGTGSQAPNQLYYDPRVNAGHLYPYPTFGDADSVLIVEIASPIEDFSSSSDDFDLPQEWGAALKFNLALHLGLEYEVPEEKFKQIATLAATTFNMVKDFDQESPTSVYFGISPR